MIRDFVHLIQNKLRHYAVFPSLHSLSRSSAFQTALFCSASSPLPARAFFSPLRL